MTGLDSHVIVADMNIVSYIRVSSKGQLDGDGPNRQRDAIKKFCREHKLAQTWEFFERGVSGTAEVEGRAAFTEMLAWIDQSTVEAVVIEKLDRLARDLMVSEFLLTELRKRGIKVFATDQGAAIDVATNEGDPTRKLIRQIIGALSEWEKSQLVVKLRAARQRKKSLTGRCEGTEPYGQVRREKYPGQNIKERAILGWIKTWRETLSTPAIARMLNDGGFSNRQGKPFNHRSVLFLIKNNNL